MFPGAVRKGDRGAEAMIWGFLVYFRLLLGESFWSFKANDDQHHTQTDQIAVLQYPGSARWKDFAVDVGFIDTLQIGDEQLIVGQMNPDVIA